MRKFLFPRIHGPDYDLCIRSIHNLKLSLFCSDISAEYEFKSEKFKGCMLIALIIQTQVETQRKHCPLHNSKLYPCAHAQPGRNSQWNLLKFIVLRHFG